MGNQLYVEHKTYFIMSTKVQFCKNLQMFDLQHLQTFMYKIQVRSGSIEFSLRE